MLAALCDAAAKDDGRGNGPPTIARSKPNGLRSLIPSDYPSVSTTTTTSSHSFPYMFILPRQL